jgi:uncharacterized protein YaaQ
MVQKSELSLGQVKVYLYHSNQVHRSAGLKDLRVPEKVTSQPEKQNLLIVVVQGQDVDLAIDSLQQEAFTVTRLPSVGGFLGRRNATLMVGVEAGTKEKAIEILNKNCRQRVAFIAVPMENSPLPMPAPTPVTIGGASIFSVEVEHYEEF